MNIFSKKFAKSLLQEAEVAPPPPPVDNEVEDVGMDDEAAFASTLDTGTAPDEFNDVQGAQAEVDNLQAAERMKHSETINNWISELGKMTLFLNGTNDETQEKGMGPSVQSQLADSPCDSMLDSISKSETKKITRIAQELSALGEALKGHIQASDGQV